MPRKQRPIPEEGTLVHRSTSRPYRYRRDSCPKHDGSGLLPCTPGCKGCAWEEAMISRLGPPPPVSQEIHEGHHAPASIPGSSSRRS